MDGDSKAWWSELENLGELKPNWCCKLIHEGGLEALQWVSSDKRINNIIVNFCPQCGRKFIKNKRKENGA